MRYGQNFGLKTSKNDSLNKRRSESSVDEMSNTFTLPVSMTSIDSVRAAVNHLHIPLSWSRRPCSGPVQCPASLTLTSGCQIPSLVETEVQANSRAAGEFS